MDALFAVAWLLSVTVCDTGTCKTIERPVGSLYLCQTRASAVVAFARKDRKVEAECLTVHGDKLPV
jgi:hypothetical protein